MIGKLTKNTFVLLFLAACASFSNAQLQNGYGCSSDTDCISNYCSQNVMCSDPYGSQPLGTGCSGDSECESNYCGSSWNCEVAPGPPTEPPTAFSNAQLQNGYSCSSGIDCISNYCTQTGFCADPPVTTLPLGMFCSIDSQCESNYCGSSWNCEVAPAPPTEPPTASPTNSLADPGSFEIHSTGNVAGTAISGSTIAILAAYNASNRVHNTTVLSPDCITPFPANVAEAFTVTTTEPMSLGDGFIAYNSTIEVDISKVNTTDPWKPLSDGVVGGVLDLCLESAIFLELYGINEKMNFVNTNLTLTVEMDANFEVTTINAERKEAKAENLNLAYSNYVTAYECVESDLVNKANNQEYSQGDELKICVKSKDPTIVQVGGIQRLTLSQDDDTTTDDFTYITGGSPVSSEIAATTCDKTITPAHVCHADMQLLGRYFEDESPGELTATGSVKLSFPGGSRRLTVDVPIAGGIRGGDDLALENSARRMEETPPEDSLFDVKVSLTKSLVESGTSDYYGVSLVSGLVAAAGGVILMI